MVCKVPIRVSRLQSVEVITTNPNQLRQAADLVSDCTYELLTGQEAHLELVLLISFIVMAIVSHISL